MQQRHLTTGTTIIPRRDKSLARFVPVGFSGRASQRFDTAMKDKFVASIGMINHYGQSPYQDSGFQGVWLKQNLNFKGWNSQAIGNFQECLSQGILVGIILAERLDWAYKRSHALASPRHVSPPARSWRRASTDREFTKGGLVKGGFASYVLLSYHYCQSPLY